MESPKENTTTQAAHAAVEFPAGLHHAYWFATFNALSFQNILNNPMVLYGKSLGATETVIGVIAGMWALLVIFQIPAAQYVNRVGYRRFVYGGWGIRVCFIFGMALVPLTGGFLDRTTQLVLLLLLLFGFNLSRGISSAGWLPWIASLIPENIRGRYLARDAACVNLASFVGFLIAAACLGSDPQPWRFAVLFAFSAVTGAISLTFLKRIPDVAPPQDDQSRPRGRVPWFEMVNFPPFKKLLMMVVAWSAAYGAITAFTAAFLKGELNFGDDIILFLNSAFFLGGLSSLLLIESRLDRLGSKPVVTFALVAWVLVAAVWAAVAGKMLHAGMALVFALQFFMGLCGALVSMSNVRLVMEVVPAMGRNHFFALYSVIGSLTLGVAPILWGLGIDAIGARQWNGAHFIWNRFSAFFVAVALVFLVAIVFARRLDEPRAKTMDALLRDLFVHTPQRVWARLWPRF